MRPSSPSKPRFGQSLNFWIIALIAFLNSVSFTIIIPILYPYAKQFGLSDVQASLLTTSYAISQFFATPVLGRFSDFWGRKPLLVISLIGTVLANLAASFTPFAGLLFAARILDGLTGGNTSIARAVISDITTPAERAEAFGLFDAAFRMGFVMGPAISFFAQELPTFLGVSPLGMSFFAGAGMAFVAAIMTLLLLPETLPQKKALQLDWTIFGFKKIVQSAIHPNLGPSFILTFLVGFTFTIFTFAFQPFFLNVLRQDAQTLAIVFTVIGLVGVLTQIFAVGPLTQRFNLVNVLSGAIAARGLVFLCIPLLPVLPAFIVLAALLGITNSFPIPIISSILSINTSNREQGEVLGVNSSYLSISNALGPVVAGWLVSISYSTPFWVTGLMTLLTAGFAMRLKGTVSCTQKDG